MKVFVTGGSGFVGGHLIERLAQQHEVFALARSEAAANKVAAFGATPVRASLASISAEHLRGMDAVIHAAAHVEEWGPEEAYWEANVVGTQRMLDVARAASVGRFVLVSTNATVFDRLGQRDVDETHAYPAHAGFPYGLTKAEAERRVLAANAPGFTTVSVRPCFVWGPRDTTLLPALRRMADQGGFVWLDGGRAQVSITHVGNLVEALVCALSSGRGGEAYFVADPEPTDVRGLLTRVASEEGLALKGPSLPGGLVRGVARCLESTYRTLGIQRTPPVTHMAACLMSRDMTVSTLKAQAELGWRPQAFEPRPR